MSEAEQAGRRIQGLFLPFFDGAALEIRKDCPAPGQWAVGKRWPDDGPAREVAYVFAGPKAERRAWRQYYLCEAEIAAARAERFYGEE